MRFLLPFLLLSVLFGCNTAPENKGSNKAEQVQEKEKVEITIIAKGETMTEISFEPQSISVPANSRVILSLKNESKADGMFHNFVLVKLGSGKEISTAGLQAGKQKEFVPSDNRVITHTKVTEMGEMTTIEFDAPDKGSYHYICTYPGHTNMIGRFNVI